MRRAEEGANILGVFRVKNHYFTPKNHSFYNYGGRREKFWGISCEKSRFYAKKTYFFPILGRDPFEYQRISPVNQYLHPSTTTTPSTTASSYMHQPNPWRGSNRIHPIPNILNLYTFSHVKVRLFIMYYV